MKRIANLLIIVAVVLIALLVLFTFLIREGFAEGDLATHAAALADFDGDGDLDLVLANDEYLGTVPDPVWWNDGQGRFTDSGTRLDEYYPNSFRAATGDFNDDGWVDILFGVAGSGWLILNEGAGQFAPGRLIPAHELTIGPVDVAPGDLDGDGDLDVLIAVCCGTGDDAGMYNPPRHRAFINNGASHFTIVPDSLGEYGTRSVALGDLDGDGDLDAFLGNSFSRSSDEPDTIWLNDGTGRFSDTGQRLGALGTNAVALGDLDGDGDLDAFTGHNGQSKVWFNDRAAAFSDSGQRLAGDYTRFVYLADLDGDSDLDALVEGSRPRGNRREGLAQVWLNNGAGHFTPGEDRITFPADCAAVPGDVDGDGDIDIVAGCVEREVRVWLNDGAGQFARQR